MGLKVTLVKSFSGASDEQVRTIKGLGLRKMDQERLLKDTSAVRGMVRKVQHLVRQEVVAEEPVLRKRMKPRKIRERDAKRAEAAR